MKKTALILLVAFSSPIIMLGQEKVDPIQSERPQKKSRIENMAQDLSLTDDQVVQVKEIHQSYKPRFVAARQITDDADGAWKMDTAPKEWNADRMVESKEFMEVLDQCRDRLSGVQQAVFTLKFIDGEKSEDICKELNITSSNYWVLVHRAKLQLRNCLEINWMT